VDESKSSSCAIETAKAASTPLFLVLLDMLFISLEGVASGGERGEREEQKEREEWREKSGEREERESLRGEGARGS